jgi:hypothetical protein
MNESESVKQVDVRNVRWRKRALLVLFLIIFIGLVVWLLWQKPREYDLNVEPKANMVLINKVLTESTICDEQWISEVEKLSKKLDQEVEKIEGMKMDDPGYNEILSEFAILQAEVSHSLQELLGHVNSDQKIENQTLIDNLNYTYLAYKNHYQTKVQR